MTHPYRHPYRPRPHPRHHPRHRRSRAAYRPHSASDRLLVLLLAACLLGAALTLGGLLTDPFSPLS